MMTQEQLALRAEDDRLAGLWLEQIAAGNEVALEQFYRRFGGRVQAFAFKRLNDAAEAADVVNDVMMQVWRAADRFEQRSRPLTWVLGIARHKVMDKLRQRMQRPTEALDENAPDEAGRAACDVVLGSQHAALIRKCLGELSPNHRQVVQLAFFDELSYPEIARVMACPEGTVKTRMMHAKQGLKRCLAGLMEAPA